MSAASSYAEWVLSFSPKSQEWVLPEQYDISSEINGIKRSYGAGDEWNTPANTLDAVQDTIDLTRTMRRAIASKFLGSTTGIVADSYLEQYIMPGSPEFICASVFRQLSRQADRLSEFAKALRAYIEQYGNSWSGIDAFPGQGGRSFRRQVEMFWGERPGLEYDEEDRQIWQPEAAYPYAAMNWCRVEIKSKEDTASGLWGGDEGNTTPSGGIFVNFFTSPIGIGIIALSGVLVARRLTR